MDYQDIENTIKSLKEANEDMQRQVKLNRQKARKLEGVMQLFKDGKNGTTGVLGE